MQAVKAKVARMLQKARAVYHKTDWLAAKGWMEDAIQYNQTG